MRGAALGFRPAASLSRTVRWRPAAGIGLEHLHLVGANDGSITATGVVIGERGGRPYGMRYVIDCNPRWRVTGFSIIGADGRTLAATSDTKGNWRGADGSALPRLSGAIDIDLAGTPFTNTLPIRRTALGGKGRSREFTMLYVPFDTLDPIIDEQRYTCVDPWRVYRYEAVDRSFAAQLSVDLDGLVVDYPGLFSRL